jgi:hypothetical protein
VTQTELDDIVLCIATKGVDYAETTCDFRRQSDPDARRREEEYMMLRNIIFALHNYDLDSGILEDNEIQFLFELATLILEKCPNIGCRRQQGTWVFLVPAPVALDSTNVDYFSFDANWEEISGAHGYLLDVSADPDFGSFLSGFENLDVGTALTWSIPGLDYNTTYYYRLRAYYQTDISSNSNVIDTQTAILASPEATAATGITYESFFANWNIVPDADGYYLDVSTDPDFGSFVPGYNNLDVGNSLIHNITGLDDNETYYYRLMAYTSVMTSHNSNVISLSSERIWLGCATYQPYFETPPVDHSMFLSCGKMKLTSGSIGDYFIEWHLGSPSGTIVFTSGETIDPGEVQVQHPFIDEVVFAGTLYPVIKYVDIDGIRYSAYWNVDDRYSPSFLSCLNFTNNTPGTVIIDAIECTTVLGADPLYPYSLTYTNGVDLAVNKSRTLKYNICGPGMKYLAVEFDAYQVADQLKIYYCTIADENGVLLENWIHGNRGPGGGTFTENLYPDDYPNNPRCALYGRTGTSPLCFITDIRGFTFTAGDYLRIEISGAVYEPTNSNTNWYIKFKSLTVLAATFITDTGLSKITDTPSISYISDPSCRYEVAYNTTDDIDSVPQRFTGGVPDLYKYLWFWITQYSNPANAYMENPVRLGLPWKSFGSNFGLFSNTGFNVLSNLDPGEQISLQKSGNDYIFTFSDVDDYNKMKSDIAELKAHSSYTTWQGLTDTDSRYYAAWLIYFNVAESVGDNTGSNHIMYFWFGSSVAFDDVNKKITWTCQVPTNNFPDSGDCNNVDSMVTNAVSVMESTKVAIDSLWHTHVKSNGWYYSTWPYFFEDKQSYHEFLYSFAIDDCFVNGLIDMESMGFMKGLLGPGYYVNMWFLPRYMDKVTFKDISDHAHRLANWKIERRILLRTDNPADTGYEIVYETP